MACFVTFAPSLLAAMNFELTKLFLDELVEVIHLGDESLLLDMVSDLHPADIAEILHEFEVNEAKAIYKVLDAEKASEVLVHMDEDYREDFLSSLTAREIAEQLIDNLESDDAADVLSQLSEKQQEEVISFIEDTRQASDIVDLLNYDEGTAGALMGKEFVKVKQEITVAECIKSLRNQAEHVDYIYTIYVVDEHNRLQGTLPVKKLLLTPENVLISDIYKVDVIAVKTYTDSDEVAQIMEKYDLVVLPVVDEMNRLMGRITIDDVVDVIKEEAERDYQLASGISDDVDQTDTVWDLTKARLPWLLIGLAGGVLSSRVIGRFEHQLQIHPEMAFFMPLIAAMGGNVGVQSSAIIVQSLANDSVGFDGILSKLFKEFTVALVNGLVLSILILIFNLAFADSIGLSITVSAALLSVVIFAALFGTFVPLVLDKYDIDPALATGPFITTVNDVLGLFIYFFIGHLLY